MTEEGRLDAVLATAFPDLSRARVQRLISNERVLVNGEPARKSTHVNRGAKVTVTLPDSVHEPSSSGLTLSVLHEDTDLIAIDKPAGVLVHDAPAEPGAPSVALWFLEHYVKEAAAFDVERPGIVHRLDKHTSGVLLLAKKPSVQAALSAAFEAREAQKEYIALCHGVPQRDRAVIDADIGRSHSDRRRMAVTANGRSAQTEYEVLASARERSFLLVRPRTGRTHQIRVHLAAIGAPVVGDELYGRDGGGPRHLLHAWKLTVPHPQEGELTVTAPLPPDMLTAIDGADFTAQAKPYTAASASIRTEETA